MLLLNKTVYVEDTFCYKEYVYQVSKLQHMYVIGLKWISFSNLNGKFWNGSTPIWLGFLGVCFYSVAPTRFLVWKPYLYLTSHTYLTTYLTYHTTSLTDLYFNKKFEQENKSFYKSISKSIHIDTSQLKFTCSKSTIETLVKSVKYVQSNNKDTTTPMTSFWCFYC